MDDVRRTAGAERSPGRTCWIGTTTEVPPKWEVSDGPAGRRSSSTEWDTPQEAVDHARSLGLRVVFEDDFLWGPADAARPEIPPPASYCGPEVRGMDGITANDKQHVLVDCFLSEEEQGCLGWRPALENHLRPWAWRPGSDDVKLIFAISEESAVRIAVRIRMDGGMSEEEALERVCCSDSLRQVDPDAIFQGDCALWDGIL